jgi:hypothetical protein
LVIEYDGQVIDLFNIDNLRFYNSETLSWNSINYSERIEVSVEGLNIPVISKAELIRYKKGLNRSVDIKDLEYLVG